MAAVFCVYQHRRADTGAIFYVGKGTPFRASSRHGRNKHWRNVVAKCGGFSHEIVVTCESEELSYLAEAELISKLKYLGVRLTNIAAGGEGGATGAPSPFKGKSRPELSAAMQGVPKSDAHKKALSEAKKGKKHSDEARAKMSATRKGRPSSMLGKTHTEEAKRKIGDAQIAEKNHWFGKKIPSHIREALIRGNTGRVESEETRRKKSEAHRGVKNHRFGVPIPEEQKQRQITALKARPRVECPHCGIVCDESNARRWHLDNCRSKK